jgi:hypothetical protein
VEPDPDGRFLLFLTYESHNLYYLPLPSGTPTLLLSSSTTPELANVGQIMIWQHATQGRKCILPYGTRWDHVFDSDQRTIILTDSENNGSFETTEILTPAQWQSRGYVLTGNWVPFCQ